MAGTSLDRLLMGIESSEVWPSAEHSSAWGLSDNWLTS